MASASKNDLVPPTDLQLVREPLNSPVQFLGFLAAVISPFILLGLIVAGSALSNPELLGGVLFANIVGLILGQNYGQ